MALFFSRENSSIAPGRLPTELRVATPANPATGEARPALVPRGHMALGGLLVDRGLITPAQLDAAVNEQKKTGRRLGRVLVERGVLTPEALLEVLSAQLGVSTTRINAYSGGGFSTQIDTTPAASNSRSTANSSCATAAALAGIRRQITPASGKAPEPGAAREYTPTLWPFWAVGQALEGPVAGASNRCTRARGA